MRAQAILLVIAAAAAAAGTAAAGGTSIWELSSKEHFDRGTLDRVVVFSPGGIRLGPSFARYEVEETGVWSLFVTADGILFAGTARPASVYRLQNGKLERILKTEELAVTDMLVDGRGCLYAATIPEGKVFRISPDGKEAVFRIPDQYAWKLLPAPDGNIYVASGPNGKVFLMENGGGWVREVFKSGREKNIISLAGLPDGAILCGSAENGVLYRIDKSGRSEALHNFADKEIREIAVAGDGIYIATNISQKGFKQESFVNELAEVLRAEVQGTAQPDARKEFKKLMNGKIHRMDRDGRVETLMAMPANFALCMAAADGTAIVGCGLEGRVLSIDRNGGSFTLADLAEEQVIALKARNGELYAMGTGHPGKIYVTDKSPSDRGIYQSEILDTGFPSVFGSLCWEGRGSVSFETRTGNTEKPDETWSPWSVPVKASGTRIESPRARFFQFRVNFGGDSTAVVTLIRTYYARANQRPAVMGIVVGQPRDSQVIRTGGEKYAPKIMVRIAASDPDEDPLVFRLYCKETSKDRWIPLNDGRPLPKPEVEWTVTDVPDGLYQLKAEASDELVNPPGESLRGFRISDPFVIDNRGPSIEGLSVDVGREIVVRGRASDASSNITRVEYSVDGGDWVFISPSDRVFDSRTEDFSAVLPPLEAGAHRVRVRAQDTAGNAAVAEVEFDAR